MYIRFVSLEVHPDSGSSRGLFSAAWKLRDEGDLDELEEAWYEDVVGWFNVNLTAPEENRLSARWSELDRVTFWFRDSATVYIQRMRAMQQMLTWHGVPSRVLRANRPGRIVYDDSQQVAVLPFRDSVR
jgi:hypothetical protein